jgi:hypothetical protein
MSLKMWWITSGKYRGWRFIYWAFAWVKLIEALAVILSLGFYLPRWWGRLFDRALDRGWL